MLADDFFEIAQNHFSDALPFVLYKKPNTKVVKALFQNNDTVYYSKNLIETGFVFAPFKAKDDAILIPSNVSSVLEFEYTLQEKLKSQNIIRTDETEAKAFHIKIVAKAIKSIEKNIFKKVVISRNETVKLIENNPIHLFKRLLQTYPKAFTYCWYHPKIGLWLGATPETLLSVTGKRFTTMALAGTQAFKNEDTVNWKAKETEEQQLVTNFIIEQLKPITNTIAIGETQTIKAGNLLHLKTVISGIVDANLKAIVNALHPTSAVCGMPKEATKQFILANENYKREFYTGFLGELNYKEKTTRNTNRRNVENNAYATIKTVSNLFVNLRCMQLTDVKAIIYVGGGITKDSNPESEWIETVNKTETMKKVLF